MIALKNINKSYAIGREKFYALKDINLKLYSGEFVAIIGPSGSGKTTLMNIIGCLDTPDSGEYYIDDENVELPLVYRGLNNNERYEKTMKSIEMVGIIERMKHKPSEMSGGQQQRTAIARAIAGEPEIILADEPTGNLDSKSGKEIMNILTRLNNQGKTLMLITHDKEMAKYAQRIIRISDGKIN